MESRPTAWSLRIVKTDLGIPRAEWHKGPTHVPTTTIEGYKFRFYSSDQAEPPRVHVIHGENVAKIWLIPIKVEYNYGYNRGQLGQIVRLTRENRNELLEFWNEYFGR
ncbi:MAG: DUF4160 domain-containing protein [Planctomycetes bacterium]|nr:DUF4160 domain-containing protein [Planctomycetota bacterium]